MAVLYRKYRPQTFKEVVGQESIIQTLKNQVATGQISHAYLFTGSRGVGKTTVARLLAKAANCPNVNDGEPCGSCTVCQQVAQNNFMDLLEIDAASNTGVDNIRELIDHIKFAPSSGKYKVFIIDEVHMLSKGAFNALLKTLEEPPAHAIFILATTEIHKVPATIISRTQRFDFKKLTQQQLESHLHYIVQQEGLKVSHDIIELIVRLAEGGGRDALSMLDKVSALGSNIELGLAQKLLGITDIAVSHQLLSLITASDVPKLPDFFDELVAGSSDMIVFNRDFLEYLRKILVFKAAGNKLSLNLGGEHDHKAISLAEKLTLPEIIFTIRLFLKSYKDLPGAPTPELPLLLASMEAATRGAGTAPKSTAVPSAPVVTVQQTTKPHSESAEDSVAPSEVMHPVIAVSRITLAPEESAQQFDSNDSFTMEELAELWPKIANEIKLTNGPLANLVKNSPLCECEPGKIFVGVKYLFHKQNLESSKNQVVISHAIEKLSGKKARIYGTILKEEKKEPINPAGALTDALQIFGGELVE